MVLLALLVLFYLSGIRGQLSPDWSYPYIKCFTDAVRPSSQWRYLDYDDGWCDVYCYDHGSLYAYSTFATTFNSGPCLCSDVPPDFKYRYGNCGQGGSGIIARAMTEQNGFQSHYDDNCHIAPFNNLGTTVTDIYQCFELCSTWRYAVTNFASAQSTAHCRCADNDQTWVNQPVNDCNAPEIWVPYRQISVPTNSAAVVKKKRDAQHRLKMEEPTLRCPQGMKACQVTKNDDHAYECIDTSHELESCGGCIHGEIDIEFGSSSSKSPLGLDCTALTGITPSGVACYNSQCVAFDCEDGFELVDHQCVPIKA
ncbi:hypothetical protein I302_105348 [Kwoniella bestiolae CBS 10118]|uniref:Protein CPL1-like domain-containing protein n=1 Tax=Kwoniella bestiolae CBS 10118 TaxID=1296100 RepID=A0A1B9FSV7_9TREE|nr:hypothetical protein I302_08633 [Kwoniella bestiolae CBS 10118]OCF21854.1 hypothetical protein I302_08633 [Kwoniella bestiolae CBS 10118]